VQFDLYYSHRDTQQPSTFSYTNFGPKWTFTWLSYVTDNVNSTAAATVYLRGGGNEPFTFGGTGATSSYPGPYDQALLTRTVSGGSSTSFTLTLPDGSFEQFNKAVGDQFFMTAAGDAQGNKVTLTYDSEMRIVSITDAVGEVTTLTYGLSGSPLLVTKITDPFGRSASFAYNSSGQLASITDVLGITSSYAYGQGTDPDFINALTTPYGETTFIYGDSTTNPSLGDTRLLKITDPLDRTTYVEFDQGVDAGDSSGGVMINPSLIPTGMNTTDEYLQYRNTFYFDPNQYALATQSGTLNYSQAMVYHWLHTGDETTTSRVLESVKEPLENRVWYNYADQASSITFPVTSGGVVTNGADNQPTAIGRVLDNGTTQLESSQYNAEGNITVADDAVGRQTTYTYATNGIDLLEVANTTNGTDQPLETGTYNTQHELLTLTGANGKTSHYLYNAAGQLTRYTDPSGHATALTYNSSGHLQSFAGPVSGDTYALTDDNLGRIIAITDPVGSTTRFTYDAADRVTSTTYPDGASAHYAYHWLDLASYTDPLTKTTQYSYDSDRELVKIEDALSQTWQLGYNPAGVFDSITDQNSHTTSWVLDAQSRVVTKQYADSSFESISYETSDSLVAQVTDALGQTTTYSYNPDNSVATISYIANQSTPGVVFTYDPAYRRVVSMTDGTGTTNYSYYPVSSLGANELNLVTSPVAGGSTADVVTYTYDALDRVVGVDMDGQAQSIGYDAISRITSQSNPLDSFTYGYSDATPRVTRVTSNHGRRSR
jgi:YD repeat-containing protein